MIHVTETSRGKRLVANVQKLRGKQVGCRKYRSGAAYASEFAQTLPESAAGRFQDIESLRVLECNAGKGNATACYLVQVIDKPNLIIALEV